VRHRTERVRILRSAHGASKTQSIDSVEFNARLGV
jgi:hypothetical protein